MWLRIRCTNKSRNPYRKNKDGEIVYRGVCGHTLKIVNRIEVNKKEIIYCEACNAQCWIQYNNLGGCTIVVPDKKKIVEAKDYPLIGEGYYKK